jgi:hypothetical protein
VAVSLLLLVGAGLVARSLDAARRADTGFDARNVTSVTMDLRPNGYDEARGRVFYQQLLDAVRADEGIDAASLATIYPMTMVDSVGQKFVVEGYQPRRDEDLIFLFNVVTPDYFRTLRIGLVTGREFDRRDDPSAPQVAIVHDTLARRFWGSAPNAISGSMPDWFFIFITSFNCAICDSGNSIRSTIPPKKSTLPRLI